MAQLATRWKHFNLKILVTLRKGNHPGEAYVKRGQRKDLYRRKRDSLEGYHVKAEIQRKALRHGKNLVFRRDTCSEKESVWLKMTPRKVGVGLKRRGLLNKWLGWKLAWWGFTGKKDASHLLGLRGRHQYSDQHFNRNRALCVASTAMETKGIDDQMTRSSG